jgi:hypothetical protein
LAATLISAPNVIHQSIIKRFNQHSIMVMRAGQQDNNRPVIDPSQPVVKVDKTKENILTVGEEQKNVEAKRKRLHEMTGYEDLEVVPAKKTVSLSIAKADRYV